MGERGEGGPQLEEAAKRIESEEFPEPFEFGMSEEGIVDSGAGESNVPAGVREIITKSFGSHSWDHFELKDRMNPFAEERLKEENKLLKSELDRMERLLANVVSERDDIAVKYSDMSGRFESTLRTIHGRSNIGDNADSSDETETSGGSVSLLRQNAELRRTLNEEKLDYKRKLQAYQESQQKHVLLVEKLQTKVLQYKKRCTELENTMRELNLRSASNQKPLLELQRNHVEQSKEFEQLLRRVDEEVHRANNLVHINEMLQEQLNQSNASNKALNSEVQRLSNLVRDLEMKQYDWGKDKQLQDEFHMSNHQKLMSLWKAVSSLRKNFDSVRAATDRDVANMTSEMSRISRMTQNACLGLSKNSKKLEFENEKERLDKEEMRCRLDKKNEELCQLREELTSLHSQKHERSRELNHEIERLKTVISEKDDSIVLLKMKLSTLENRVEDDEKVMKNSGGRRHCVGEAKKSRNGLSKSIDHLNSCGSEESEEEHSKSDPDASHGRKSTQNNSRSHSTSPVRRHGNQNNSNNHNINSYYQSGKSLDSPLEVFQSMIHKKQMELLDLKSRLLNLSDQNYNLTRRVEDLNAERNEVRRNLETTEEEKRKLMANHSELENSYDDIKMSLDQSRFEVERLDGLRKSLLKQLEGANEDNRKLLSNNTELQRSKDSLNDEKTELLNEKERLMKEKERNHASLEQSEENIVKLKEDLVGLKEHLHKTTLRLELLEQEKKDLEHALMKTTQLKGDLELNLSKHQHECGALRDAMMRLQCLHEDVGNDNVDLKMYLKKLEGERSTLMLEKSELEQEKSHMRDVLNQLESDKTELEAEKSSLEYGNRVLKESKEKLENDFHLLMEENKKNVERMEGAMKQKMEVAGECSSVKIDLEKQNELLIKLGKDKEELAKEKMDLILQASNLERDIRRLNEEAINLKLDKERSEMQCDELNSELLGLEEKASRLEGINHELELKIENLNDEVARLTQEVDVSMEKNDSLKNLMEERLYEKEAAYQEMTRQLKSAMDGNIDKMSQEKDQMREHFERDYADLCKRFSEEKTEILTKFEREKEKMKEEVSAIKQIKEQQLLVAENEKQELINNNEADRTKLLEKISAQQKDVMNIQNSFGKLKKELESKCCQQENTISLLESDLKMAKTTLNKARNSFEKESKGLSNHLEMLTSCKADLELELSDLKAQLKAALEARDMLKNDLNEAHSSMTKIESDKEVTRKENLNLLRSLKEETCEKEMSHKMINDLKNAIKKLETEKLDLNRVILDAKQQLTGITEQKVGAQKEAFDLREALKEIEKSRLDVKKELQETRRQLKTLEMEKLKLNHEVADHLSKLERNSGKMEEMKKEILFLKQKVMEVDDSKEILKKENSQLSRRLAGSEKDAELKGEELRQLEEDSNRIETRRNEEKFRLEATLENFHQKYSDLEVKHKNSESLVKHLQEKLASHEAEKTDLEAKLTSLLTTIMRNFDQDVSKFRTRSHSFSRKGGRSTSSDGVQFGTRKRNRSHSPGRLDLSDVDVEDVKLMLRDCAQNAIDTERERDEAFSKLEMTQSKLTDMLVNQERLVSKLELVTGSLEDSDKVKRELESKIIILQSKCMQCEDVLKKEERDNRQLAERVANLEMSLRSLDKERMQFQEKINDLKNSEMKLEEEKKHLKQVIEDGEKKIGMSESAKRILEGELYRMKMALNDKETEHQVACARMDQLLRQIEDLEVRTQSYQTTIDRLNSALIRCSEEKTNHKDQMSVLNMSLSDKSNTVNSLQERLAQLHRTLACSEQDRRTLQETLENSRHSLGEAKRQIQHLQERMENTQIEMKNKESRLVELEAQSKMSQNVHARHLEEERYLNEQIDVLHIEKQNLQEMVVKLQKTLAAMEADVRDAEVSTVKLKKDKTSLKRSLNKSEEFLNKTAVEKSQMDRMLKKLEDDNFDLLHRIQSLQLQLTTAEQENRQRLLEMAARHREETDLELERLLSSKLQAEQLLEMRERSHRQNVKHLEEQISNLRDRLNREHRAKRQHESDTSPNIFSDDLLDSRPAFDKSLRGADVGGNSAYFNEAPNKRSTSPAKVISARVTRHNTLSHQKTFSPKKSFRSSSRK